MHIAIAIGLQQQRFSSNYYKPVATRISVFITDIHNNILSFGEKINKCNTLKLN